VRFGGIVEQETRNRSAYHDDMIPEFAKNLDSSISTVLVARRASAL
jgi:hypothetical protein